MDDSATLIDLDASTDYEYSDLKHEQKKKNKTNKQQQKKEVNSNTYSNKKLQQQQLQLQQEQEQQEQQLLVQQPRNLEAEAAEIDARLDKLRGVKDARTVLPVWKEQKYMHKMLHYWATQQPDKTAVEYWDKPAKPESTLTYRELDSFSRHVASVIVSKGLNEHHNDNHNSRSGGGGGGGSSDSESDSNSNSSGSSNNSSSKDKKKKRDNKQGSSSDQNDSGSDSTDNNITNTPSKDKDKDTHHHSTNSTNNNIANTNRTTFSNCVAIIHIPRGIELVVAVFAAFNAGMAYTVVDTEELSIDRLDYIMKDTNSPLLLSTHHANDCSTDIVESSKRLYVDDLIAAYRKTKVGTDNAIDDSDDDVEKLPTEDVTDHTLGLVVYTSGSTGKPKGVCLEHGPYTNLLTIELILYRILSSDRYLQTQSLSFISGNNETIKPIIAGATLVIGSSDIRRLGPDFIPWVNKAKIAAFKAVPSLLRSLISDETPKFTTLRLMSASGEALTKEIIAYFAKSVLFLQTYGPSETSSNCTYNFVLPSTIDQVTIGKAYPTFKVYLLDNSLNPSPSEGEICAEGFSLAGGYLNMAESTADRFVFHPTLGRIYRTGDIGRWQADGSIQYVGRADSQVKVNGYRIELGEVEAKMLLVPGVKEAAVIFKDLRIHGFVVLRPEGIPQIPDGKVTLTKFNQLLHTAGLGHYAMPASITVLPAMPKLVSGKVDRKLLVPKEFSTAVEFVPEVTLADSILNVFQRVLNHKVSKDSNFFEEGGDSSGAGKVITQLRNSGKEIFKLVSVKDLYANPTPEELSKVLEDRALLTGNSGDSDGSASASPLNDYHIYRCWWITLIQFFVIIVELMIDGALIQLFVWPVIDGRNFLFSIVGIYMPKWGPGSGVEAVEMYIVIHGLLLFGCFIVLSFIVLISYFLILFTLKWVLIGRYRPGIYRSRWFFVREWIVAKFNKKFPWFLVLYGPWGPFLYRLLGAKIGHQVILLPDSTIYPTGWDLLEVQDKSCVNNAFMTPVTMTQTGIICGNIKIGARAAVHAGAMLVGGNTLEDDAELGSLSSLEEGGTVPAGEYWTGSPARKSKPPPRDDKLSAEEWSFFRFQTTRTIINIISIGIFGIPGGIYLACLIYALHGYSVHLIYLSMNASSVILGAVFGFIFPPLMLRMLALICPQKSGTFPQFCFDTLIYNYKRIIFSVPTQGLLNNTFFLRHWMNACGAEIGERSEMSKVRCAIPEFLVLGSESFFTNYTILAAPEIKNGRVHLGGIQTGNMVLVGNRSVIPLNTVLPDDALVGVLSIPPVSTRVLPSKDDTENGDDSEYALSKEDIRKTEKRRLIPNVKPHVAWVGNPPYQLHQAASDPYPAPTSSQLLGRYFWDIMSICLLLFFIFTFAQIWWVSFHFLRISYRQIPETIWSGFVMLICRPTVPFLVSKLLFWILGGELKPKQETYWSSWNNRWHLYSKSYAFFVRSYFTKMLNGTIFLNWWFTWTSCMKISSSAYISMCEGFRENDLVRIGENVIINSGSEFRTHTFENWKLKFEYITVGDNCTIGHRSTLMAGSEMEEGSEVANNTLVMKKETLQAGMCYAGLTAQPVGPSRIKKPASSGSGGSKGGNGNSSKKSEKGEDDYVIFKD